MPELIRSIVGKLRAFVGNRRSAPRFRTHLEVGLAISISVPGAKNAKEGQPLKLAGYTRDISATGLALIVPAIRIGGNYIVYINEVSRLLAVSENRNWLVPDCFLNKSWNDRAVLASRILIRTKDVEVTKANRGESPFIGESVAVPLSLTFARRIRTIWLGGHAFNFWNGWVVAINCSRAAEDRYQRPAPSRCPHRYGDTAPVLPARAAGLL